MCSWVVDDVWVEIFSFLEEWELRSAICTCKWWNTLLLRRCDSLWKPFCLEKWADTKSHLTWDHLELCVPSWRCLWLEGKRNTATKLDLGNVFYPLRIHKGDTKSSV